MTPLPIQSKERTLAGEVKVYLRDNSFYSSYGRAARYHFMGDDLASRCGKVRMLDEGSGLEAGKVDSVLRCRANGCRELWPTLTPLPHSGNSGVKEGGK